MDMGSAVRAEDSRRLKMETADILSIVNGEVPDGMSLTPTSSAEDVIVLTRGTLPDMLCSYLIDMDGKRWIILEPSPEKQPDSPTPRANL